MSATDDLTPRGRDAARGLTGERDGDGAREVGGARDDQSPDRNARRSAERDRDAAEASRDRFSFVAEVSRCLAASLDYEATLTMVAGLSLPYLGAWCVVDIVEDGYSGTTAGQIRRIAVLHPDPRKEALARELHVRYPPAPDDFFGAPRAIRSGRPEMVFDVPDAALVAAAHDEHHLSLMRDLGIDAYVVVPMQARGQTVGAITFITAEEGRRFGDIDLLMAEDIATRAAMAVDNARLHRDALQARDDAETALAEAEALAGELLESRDEAELLRDSTARSAANLQALSAALSVARTEHEVAEAVVAHATAVLNAAGIVIARLTPDALALEIMSVSAMPADIRGEWGRFAVEAPVPLAEVARTGEPVFLESREAWLARYPGMQELLKQSGHHANAVVPLIVEGRVLGALGVAFDRPQAFDEDARALTLAVTQQCAQALERARLLHAERHARGEAEAARAAAETANRAKAEFLAAMSHELRTPLNAIAGYAQIIEMGIHGPVTDAQREALQRIDLAHRHLLSLVNDVLNFARLQAGRLEYDIRRVALAEVIESVAPLLEPQLEAKHLSYSAAVRADCAVMADQSKLTQVLLNLLSNAIKFTTPGGSIEVECAQRADGTGDPTVVFLRVSDTGLGIPKARLEDIFEPFIQVDASPANRKSGAGLGLAISRDLTRGMGGDIRVRSVPGTGTTFTVTLPRG